MSEAMVAVVGGASLIGTHLIELMQEERPDWSIRVLDNFATGDPDGLRSVVSGTSTTVQRLDVRDRSACAAAIDGCRVVFHLAAMLSMSFVGRMREAVETNVLGSLNVIEACAEAGARLVLSSSCGGVYGIPPAGAVTENTPFWHAELPVGTAMYGAGKLMAEKSCEMLAETRGLAWFALRYSSVYGARQHDRGRHTAALAVNLRRMSRGAPARFDRSPDETHDYIDARDVARANLQAAEADATACCRALTIASGTATTNAELADCFARVTGCETPVVWPAQAPPPRPPVSYDVTAAARSLGFRARITLVDGLVHLLRSLDVGDAKTVRETI